MAISVVVKPSGVLLAAVGVMGAMTLFAAGMVASGKVGELSIYPRLLVTAFCIAAALAGFFQAFWNRKTFRVDISGIGQIRLREYNGSTSSSLVRGVLESDEGGELEVVKLMADSTIWPHLLLLRFQLGDGRITALPILPDCVSEESFRALAVACRWIAAQNTRAEGELI